MTNISIVTNGKPRGLICLADLSEKERADFGYIGEDDSYSPRLFRYKGEVYDTCEFMRADRDMFGGLRAWHGYQSDSYFSGVVVRYCDDYEQVIVGRYNC